MVEVNDPDSNNETINCCGMKATLRMGPKYAAGQRKANDSDMRHVIVPDYLRWRCGPQMRLSRISFSFFFFRFSSSRRASSLNATSSSFLAMRALRNSSLLNASASTSMSSSSSLYTSAFMYLLLSFPNICQICELMSFLAGAEVDKARFL